MGWSKSLMVTLFAASQVFVAAFIVATCFQGYGDDAYSMALIATLVAAIFGAPAMILKCAGKTGWVWGGTQALLSLFAIGCAGLLRASPEGGQLAVPLLVVGSVTVLALYLATVLASYRAAILGGLVLAAIAVLLAIPIARL